MLKQIVFAVLLTASLAMFAWTLRRFTKMLLAGRPEKRTDHVEARVDSLLSFFFGQRKVIETVDIPASRWPRFSNLIGSRHHFIIFWGFLVICLGTLETFAQGLWPAFSWSLVLGDTLAGALDAAVDSMNLLVLAVIGFRSLPPPVPQTPPHSHEPRRRRDSRGHCPSHGHPFRNAQLPRPGRPVRAWVLPL